MHSKLLYTLNKKQQQPKNIIQIHVLLIRVRANL